MTKEERASRKRSVKDSAAVILSGSLNDGSACTRHAARSAVDAALAIDELVEELWPGTEKKIEAETERRLSGKYN